jgi:3-hydroxymyristoyl/3-hydroxydecanoyl-(acyl carrier protein) dehydratase
MEKHALLIFHEEHGAILSRKMPFTGNIFMTKCKFFGADLIRFRCIVISSAQSFFIKHQEEASSREGTSFAVAYSNDGEIVPSSDLHNSRKIYAQNKEKLAT